MKKYLLILLVAVALISLAFYRVYAPRQARLAELAEKRDARRERVKALEMSRTELNEKLHRFEKDPRTVESMARQTLGLLKPGETVYLLAEEGSG